MNEERALLKAIIAQPDEDTARLVYADWLDENRPDAVPSPSSGPSARAEYIRVQCRLAAGAFDARDYPELLEKERDLAEWLTTHDLDSDPELDNLFYPQAPSAGEWGDYRRGFLEVLGFDDYDDDAEVTVSDLVATLAAAFLKTPARTLRMESATAEELDRLVAQPVYGHLRGLRLDGLDDAEEDAAVAAVAASPHSVGLRRLYLDFPLEVAGCRALARSRCLGNLESLVIDYPIPASAVKQFIGAKWFRNLRRLHLWTPTDDVFRVLADVPPMPRLVSLKLSATVGSSTAAVRRFAASESFPRLAHLDLTDTRLSPDHVALLARGNWQLRHLALGQTEVRKAGAEALAVSPFARSLRVLDLPECEITAGGVQALADSPALAGLRHLDLSANPIGPGGLIALAGSENLRGLRSLDLARTNTVRAPVAAREVVAFLAALAMPELRHLSLDSLPVALRGARVLALSPAFANLTRLQLEGCALGDRGAAALVASRTLENLVVLNLNANKIRSGCAKLAGSKVLPRLAYCRLGTGVPRAVYARLCRRPGIRG
jgi:uncharacterized protein (TIGR02996 family)